VSEYDDTDLQSKKMIGYFRLRSKQRPVGSVVVLGTALVLLIYAIDVTLTSSRRDTLKSLVKPSLQAASVASTSKYGCKHFYFDLGTNNALSVADFINKPSADNDGKVSRPLNKYREEHNLKLSDFCVFGFEPNPRHSADHRRIESSFASTVRHVEIFSESIAGIEDGVSVLQIDNYEGKFPSWGSSVLTGFGPIARQANTTSVRVKSVDFGRFVKETLGESGAAGKVILRMDIEGSEYILLRTFMDVVCKHVNFLEIEWHAHQLNPPPHCVQSTLHWMLSDSRCKPQWLKPTNPSGCDPWKISDAFSG
jgi:hypothetical protein